MKVKIGIDLGGSHIGIGVVDANGRIVEKIEKRFTSTEKKCIKKVIEGYISEHVLEFAKKYKISEVGIGAPGSIENGMILESANLGIKNYAIVEKLQEMIQLPIKIQNDAKCASLAEHAYGCLKGYDRSLFLTLGTGIGGAIFINGQLLESVGKSGCEPGHMVIDKNGIPCNCGRIGCFERYASMKALKNNLRNALHLDETTRGEELFELIRKNNPTNEDYEIIENVVSEYIENLSIGLINLVQIFGPEMIGIGGSFVYFKEVLLERLKEKMNKTNLIIETAILGNDAGMIGAVL